MRSHANRVPQNPGRKKITPEGGAAYYATVENADNPVIEGAVVDKAMLDEFLAASGTTAGSGASFTLAQEGFSLFDGALVRIKLNRDMVAGATLNVNGTGAKAIVDAAGNAVSAGAVSGSWLDLIYSSSGKYVLQSSGQAGCAQASYPVAQAVTAGEIVDIVGGKATKPQYLSKGTSAQVDSSVTDGYGTGCFYNTNKLLILRGGTNGILGNVSGTSMSFSSKFTVNLSYLNRAGITLLPMTGSQIILLYAYGYTEEGSHYDYSEMAVLTISGSSVSASKAVGIDDLYSGAAKLNSSTFLVAGTYDSSSNTRFYVSTISGGAITKGAQRSITGKYTIIAPLTSTSVLLKSKNGAVAILNVSGTDVTKGSDYSAGLPGSGYSAIPLSGAKVVLGYNGKLKVATVNGTTISLSTEYTCFSEGATVMKLIPMGANRVAAIGETTNGLKVALADFSTSSPKISTAILISSSIKSWSALGTDTNTPIILYREGETGPLTAMMLQSLNQSTEAIAMQTVSSGNVPVCFDGNMSLPGKTRGQEIRSYDNQLVGYCYADGKVNVIGKWKR